MPALRPEDNIFTPVQTGSMFYLPGSAHEADVNKFVKTTPPLLNPETQELRGIKIDGDSYNKSQDGGTTTVRPGSDLDNLRKFFYRKKGSSFRNNTTVTLNPIRPVTSETVEIEQKAIRATCAFYRKKLEDAKTVDDLLAVQSIPIEFFYRYELTLEGKKHPDAVEKLLSQNGLNYNIEKKAVEAEIEAEEVEAAAKKNTAKKPATKTTPLSANTKVLAIKVLESVYHQLTEGSLFQKRQGYENSTLTHLDLETYTEIDVFFEKVKTQIKTLNQNNCPFFLLKHLHLCELNLVQNQLEICATTRLKLKAASSDSAETLTNTFLGLTFEDGTEIPSLRPARVMVTPLAGDQYAKLDSQDSATTPKSSPATSRTQRGVSTFQKLRKDHQNGYNQTTSYPKEVFAKQIASLKDNRGRTFPALVQPSSRPFKSNIDFDIKYDGLLSQPQLEAWEAFEGAITRTEESRDTGEPAAQFKLTSPPGHGKTWLLEKFKNFYSKYIREFHEIDLNTPAEEIKKLFLEQDASKDYTFKRPLDRVVVTLDEAFFYGTYFKEIIKNHFTTTTDPQPDFEQDDVVEQYRNKFILNLRQRGAIVVISGASETVEKLNLVQARQIDKVEKAQSTYIETAKQIQKLESKKKFVGKYYVQDGLPEAIKLLDEHRHPGGATFNLSQAEWPNDGTIKPAEVVEKCKNISSILQKFISDENGRKLSTAFGTFLNNKPTRAETYKAFLDVVKAVSKAQLNHDTYASITQEIQTLKEKLVDPLKELITREQKLLSTHHRIEQLTQNQKRNKARVGKATVSNLTAPTPKHDKITLDHLNFTTKPTSTVSWTWQYSIPEYEVADNIDLASIKTQSVADIVIVPSSVTVGDKKEFCHRLLYPDGEADKLITIKFTSATFTENGRTEYEAAFQVLESGSWGQPQKLSDLKTKINLDKSKVFSLYDKRDVIGGDRGPISLRCNKSTVQVYKKESLTWMLLGQIYGRPRIDEEEKNKIEYDFICPADVEKTATAIVKTINSSSSTEEQNRSTGYQEHKKNINSPLPTDPEEVNTKKLELALETHRRVLDTTLGGLGQSEITDVAPLSEFIDKDAAEKAAAEKAAAEKAAAEKAAAEKAAADKAAAEKAAAEKKAADEKAAAEKKAKAEADKKAADEKAAAAKATAAKPKPVIPPLQLSKVTPQTDRKSTNDTTPRSKVPSYKAPNNTTPKQTKSKKIDQPLSLGQKIVATFSGIAAITLAITTGVGALSLFAGLLVCGVALLVTAFSVTLPFNKSKPKTSAPNTHPALTIQNGQTPEPVTMKPVVANDNFRNPRPTGHKQLAPPLTNVKTP